TASAAVVNVAVPVLRVAVPSVLPLSRNVTVPVGVPLPGATAPTVTVKVTDWPNTAGLAEAVTVALLLAWLTTCGSVADVLRAELVSPPKTAVIVWLPTDRVEIVNVATPVKFSVPVPSVVLPSRKETVPVGVTGPTTEAVKVTAWPKADGLSEDSRIVLV